MIMEVLKMNDFIFESNVTIIYGSTQMDYVIQEIRKLGTHALLVPAHSFIAAGNLAPLTEKLEQSGLATTCLDSIRGPMLSKVNEGIQLCLEYQIDVVLGIGGGVCIDLAKAIAFGAKNPDTPIEKYLTYELSAEGLPHLPLVTIPTNPMSGSETNADVQITFDDSGLQAGCSLLYPAFTWLNPDYMMTLPDSVLTAGQITAFVQLSLNYLSPDRSMLAEHYAEGSMKTILASLRLSLAEQDNKDARGTLLLNSALSLSSINDLGRSFDFVPYPLQSFAQRYLRLNYPQALTGLFPYWLKEIYRASEDKAIFYRYFEEILHVKKAEKDDETLLQEALAALSKLYEEFHIAFSYGDIANDPEDHQQLVDIIDSFGPMNSLFMPVPSEKLAQIIEDAIAGNLLQHMCS